MPDPEQTRITRSISPSDLEEPRSSTPRVPKNATVCIYFPDRERLNRLKELLAKYPRASLSSLFAQMVDPLAEAMEQLSDNQREVQLNLSLWI